MPEETVHATGTEPFWNALVSGGDMQYSQPDDPDGQTVAVSRFAGRGGVSFSGRLQDQDLVLAVTDARCTDGMSERSYPFTATLRIGDVLQSGCAWTQRRPYTGGE